MGVSLCNWILWKRSLSKSAVQRVRFSSNSYLKGPTISSSYFTFFGLEFYAKIISMDYIWEEDLVNLGGLRLVLIENGGRISSMGKTLSSNIFDNAWHKFRITSDAPCSSNPTVTVSMDDVIATGVLGVSMCDRVLEFNRHCWRTNSCSSRIEAMLDEIKIEHANPVVTTTSTTVAPTSAAIKVCANEGGYCQCTGRVYYGKRFVSGKPGTGERMTFEQMKMSAFKTMDVQQKVWCANPVFGDPIWGYYKQCFCEEEVRRLRSTVFV